MADNRVQIKEPVWLGFCLGLGIFLALVSIGIVILLGLIVTGKVAIF